MKMSNPADDAVHTLQDRLSTEEPNVLINTERIATF